MPFTKRRVRAAVGTTVVLLAAVANVALPHSAEGQALHVPSPASLAARRLAVLERLGRRLHIVPSQSSFKADDQAGFQQATDFLYLTGLDDLVGAALVFDGASRTITLFLPRPNPVITRPRLDPGPAAARSMGVDSVAPIDSLGPWLVRRLPLADGVSVSPNDLRGTVGTPPPMAGTVARWASWLAFLGYRGDVMSAVGIVRSVREVKDSWEVGVMERVGTMSGAAMLAGLTALRPGRSQRTVEAAVLDACVAAGGRHSFWPWAMSGPHAEFTDLFNSFVDYEGHNRVMRAGEVVRVDVGCQADHYQGDVGRTAPVSGRFTAGQREAWDLFIAGYLAGLTRIRDGARATDVYRTALDRIRQLQPSLRTEMGKHAAAVLLGSQGTEAWEIHGVGLDDAEGLPEILKAGMTVAYELMFTVDGNGFYLEDMILVRKDGYKLLTPGLPYTAVEIERAMRVAR